MFWVSMPERLEAQNGVVEGTVAAVTALDSTPLY